MIFNRTSNCLLLAFLLCIQVFKGQVTITIPTNNLNSSGLTPAEWRKPLGTYYGYERSAMIYQHSEIGQYGNITSISFYCDTINLPGNVPVNVYMKEVSSYSFTTTGYVTIEESGAQVVYSGTIPASSFVKGQWIMITLTNPFLHATANPVEIIIETNAGGAGNEGILGKGFYHYATSFYAFQYWAADNAAPTGLGTLSYKRPNIQLGLAPVAGCSGTPNGGTTQASADTTCGAIDLYLTGSTAATGLTYQWQDSLAGGGWTNIAAASNSVLSTNVNVDTWFRCKVSCSGQFSYSSVKQVVVGNYLQCYCNTNLGGGCSGSAIDSVAIVGTFLVTSATGCSANNYTLYPASGNTCAQLASGQSYDLHTRFNGLVIASVWLDYDQNGSFDSSEWTQITATAKIDSDYVTTLAVPAGAKTGLTLMRIRSRASGNANGYADACASFGSGETEDYFIGINYDVNVNGIVVTELQVLLYPNPASQGVWIIGNFTKGEKLHVEIFSAQGELIYSRNNLYEGNALYADLSGITRGSYFVRLSGTRASIVKKLIVAN